MNSAAIRAEGSLHPDTRTEFRQGMDAWRGLLAHCGRKVGRKYVHNLRVATLRLQASLEYWLIRQAPNTPDSEAVQRWRRQGRKLRRALAPVRQADVSLNKLARVRSWADRPADRRSAVPKECLDAIDQIERVVRHRRDAAAKKLVADIDRRRKRLTRSSRKVEKALEGFAPAAESGAADQIHAQLVAAAAEFPVLDDENLHAFRKRIKKIRYLAEILAPGDSTATVQAATLKRMTAAVGEWHDWHVLTEEAAHADRDNAAMAAAAKFLQAQADRSFTHALKVCRQSMEHLLKCTANGHDLDAKSAPKPVQRLPRKPVASVPPDLHHVRAERPVRAS